MKQKLLLLISFALVSISLTAQDNSEKKWSIEANYPISVGDELGNDTPAILDLGLKYRFLDLNIVKIGAGINTGVFTQNVGNEEQEFSVDFDETYWLIQPKIFAEFDIPGVDKLRPSFGLGYTFVESKAKGLFAGESVNDNFSSGGLNVNLGLTYDLTEKFFLQAQYDYIRDSADSEFEGNNFRIEQNLSFIKLGVGFRF
ncbi:outer membrane protein [Cellulophaga sp. L1A9]|uniref:outer membrane protein n=1 Tax=Cellulophaga sp. L1A9 TaxID=2686362 RepID=UPI00131AEA6C|nr:outer membrane beta-barrel protein [Cellulophaga sp. L1A9]